MLVGDRAKHLGIVMGITFASLLITQQSAIFVGPQTRTYSAITDLLPDVWMMDLKVQFIDDIKPMQSTKLLNVRGVGASGSGRCRSARPAAEGAPRQRQLPDRQRDRPDDATLIGGPPTMVEAASPTCGATRRDRRRGRRRDKRRNRRASLAARACRSPSATRWRSTTGARPWSASRATAARSSRSRSSTRRTRARSATRRPSAACCPVLVKAKPARPEGAHRAHHARDGPRRVHARGLREAHRQLLHEVHRHPDQLRHRRGAGLHRRQPRSRARPSTTSRSTTCASSARWKAMGAERHAAEDDPAAGRDRRAHRLRLGVGLRR